MLQHALAYGGRPLSTNGLPMLGGEWSYIQDEHGVGLMFAASRYGEVEAFLTSAFGSRSNPGGWGVRDTGAAIYLQTNNTSTLVGVHPSQLETPR
jgi:hypothetical protein